MPFTVGGAVPFERARAIPGSAKGVAARRHRVGRWELRAAQTPYFPRTRCALLDALAALTSLTFVRSGQAEFAW